MSLAPNVGFGNENQRTYFINKTLLDTPEHAEHNNNEFSRKVSLVGRGGGGLVAVLLRGLEGDCGAVALGVLRLALVLHVGHEAPLVVGLVGHLRGVGGRACSVGRSS